MREGNPRPDEEPTPPTSTHWSDDTDGEDEELAPPFIPGAAPAPEQRSGSEPEESDGPAHDDTSLESAAAEPGALPEAEPQPTEPDTGAPETAADEAFPFEQTWGGEEDEDEAAESFPFEAAGESEDEPPVAEETLTDAEPAGADVAEPGAIGPEAADAAAESEMPWEAEGEEPWEAEPAGVSGESEAASETDAVADRLEAMARRLREEGASAAEDEMRSQDRFTSLLAGLLAGYLAGRE